MRGSPRSPPPPRVPHPYHKTTHRQPFAGPAPSQKSKGQVAFRPDLPLEPTAVVGEVPGGRARVRVGSSCPIRLARIPGSTVSPQSRQRTPQIGSLFAEPPVSSRRMATMRPRHREQLTSNLPGLPSIKVSARLPDIDTQRAHHSPGPDLSGSRPPLGREARVLGRTVRDHCGGKILA